jgi:hypothetical protein
MIRIATAAPAQRGNAILNQPFNITLLYKYLKASIAFVLMLIAATGWCV